MDKTKSSYGLSVNLLLGFLLVVWAGIEFKSLIAVALAALFWAILNLLLVVEFLPFAGPIIYYQLGHGWASKFILAEGLANGVDFTSFLPFAITFWAMFIYGVLINISLIILIVVFVCLRRGM